MDSGHFVGPVLGARATLERAVPALLLPVGRLSGWPVLRSWADLELVRDQPLSSALHVRNPDWYASVVVSLWVMRSDDSFVCHLSRYRRRAVDDSGHRHRLDVLQ